MQQIVANRRSARSSVLLFAFVVSTASCAAVSSDSRFADWVDKDAFPGATPYWIEKTKESTIPAAGVVPFPRYLNSRLINLEAGETGTLARLLLVSDAQFNEVLHWHEQRVSKLCIYERTEDPVNKIVLARRCNASVRKPGQYDLFTNNPIMIVKQIPQEYRNVYGAFRVTIEIAYNQNGD